MTERVRRMLDLLQAKEYRKNRRHMDHEIGGSRTDIFKEVLSRETPFLFEDDRIGFHRTTDRMGYWGSGNVTPNYGRLLSEGFDRSRERIRDSLERADTEEKRSFGEQMLASIDALYGMTEQYRLLARRSGHTELEQALAHIPHNGARSFYEALVFMKLSIYFLRCAMHTHITLGRFDQYMYPFYLMSREKGATDEEIFELLEEFFISINFDSDLYQGMQQGDNGQSMVLGGFDGDGRYLYNELSEMCMNASLELKLIDPKINLRVGKNTPDEIFERATHLTKAGLGFPQYCNDDVVIPGLVKLGYDEEDARDYSVAACWEYIIPNCGADIPNLATMDFPGVVRRTIVEQLGRCESFDRLMDCVRSDIAAECERIAEQVWWLPDPSPLLSVYFDGCVETLTDLFAHGTKYNNYGCHGAGIANATDALAAVKRNVYEDGTIGKEELLAALEADFEGYSALRSRLRNSPKMGNNDDFADEIASQLTTAFAESLNRRKNRVGGCWRAGTGSAMEYILTAKKCPATADGRKAFEPYSSSYSPSLDVKTTGLLSVIQSFTKYDLTNIINGGPLTLEIHDSVLKHDIGIQKTAMLVKTYVRLGGHQLQLNSINRDTLLDAQKHPEKYPNLIVRVWGWSGYFNELDLAYQNHVIRRLEYGL